MYLESSNLLADEQSGFRKNRSCEDQAFILYSSIKTRLGVDKDTYCCFIDFKKCFDRIDRHYMKLDV